MSSRKSAGNKRKIQFREEGDEAEQTDVAPGQPAVALSRRDQQREIAQRRAAHFARADPVTLVGRGSNIRSSHTPVSSTPTGYLRRSSFPASNVSGEGEDSEPLEAWPGPFSTARDMIAKRDEAKRLREEAIAARVAGCADVTAVEDESLLDDYDRALKHLVWPIVSSSSSSTSSSNKGFANRGPIPSLTSLCAVLLARHFDQIEGKELSYLQLEERENVATQLAKLRKCDAAAALKLAVEGSQCLVLPECSEVDEETLVKAMEQAAGVAAVRQLEPEENTDEGSAGKAKKPAKGKKKAAEVEVDLTPPPSAAALRVLKLKNVGWGMVDRSAAACINLTQGCLEVLQLTGCYRLNDLALNGLLSANKDTLLSLDLSCNSRIGAAALQCIRALTNLQELTLDNCTHLTDEALLHLLTDRPSEFTANPSSIHNAGGPAGGAASSNAPSSSSSSSTSVPPLPSLLSLSLVGLTEVTDQSVVPLVRVLGPRLQRLSLSGCVRLTDQSIHCIRQYCGHLHALGLGQLNEVTTAAMVGLFVAHPAVLSGQTGQFSYPSAPPRAARDSSATSPSSSASYADSIHSSAFSNGSSNGCSNGSSSGTHGCDDFAGCEAPPSIGRLEEVSLQGTVCVTDDVVITLCESNRRTLRMLDLSGCHQLTSRAGIALRLHARHSLETLDLSFVRGISQEALGSLVDACAAEGAALRKLTLWGCTQLTDTFFQSHQKHDLEVVGRMTA